ncbi:glutathione S-transferase [Pseudomonas sp. P5_109]|uniref:glutathione S-transferase family protein n=1 Tax=Pseudomonas sp. P5_109 TaxID=3043441 RepID=UPI002A36E56C|nr:glutathione S-transferase [Pseudomonas sp. P5_109]WPN28942.1 glutathione S-transferase [Pseudomonas sp. P5_109]
MEHTLKILGKASSINVRKVLWTCEELGLSFEREDWGSGFASTHSPEFLRLNPNAQVPVIIDEAGVLWESNTICRYLVGKHHHHHADLLPTDPATRARVEQWMDWQATELNPSWRYPFMALVRKDPEFQDAHSLEVGTRGWNQKMGILEHQLATTKAYVAGPRFTLADVVIGLSVNRWLMTPIERPDYPAVDEYFQRLAQRPGFLKHGCNGLP